MNKVQLVSFIRNAPGLIILQHVGSGYQATEVTWPCNYSRLVEDLATASGKWPAGIVASFGSAYYDVPRWTPPLLKLLTNYWNAGGLVGIDWAPDNPWTGNGREDQTWTRLSDLLLPGAPHDAFEARLNFLHDQLAVLRASGVIVLLRIFFEATYTQSSWWDCHEDWWKSVEKREQIRADFVKLWRYVHDGLSDLGDSLVFVYGMANTGEFIPADALWPGSAYCNLAGWSQYDESISGDAIGQLSKYGVPLVFSEFGMIPRDGTGDLMERLKWAASYPMMKYAVFWHSWPDTGGGGRCAIIHQHRFVEFMNDPRVITRGRIVPPTLTYSRIRAKPNGVLIEGLGEVFAVTFPELSVTAAEIKAMVERQMGTLPNVFIHQSDGRVIVVTGEDFVI
jgi:hypothetical protein